MNTKLKNLNRLLKQNIVNYYEENISHTSYIKNSLVITRLMAQRASEELCEAVDNYNKLNRMNKRFKSQGVTVTTIPQHLKKLADDKGLYREILSMVGNIFIDSLDEWQASGATYNDLFNFCCCSKSTVDRMKKDIADGYTSFSDLVCTHYPDCKSKLNYVDLQDYCPITHAVIEFMKNSVKKISDINFEPSVGDDARQQMSEFLSDIIGCALGEDNTFEFMELPVDTDFYE